MKSDFFKGSALRINFAPKNREWRIGNDRIERVIRHDPITGGLYTVSLINRDNGKEYLAEPSPEGELRLLPPFKRVASIDSDWRVTDRAPDSDWVSPDFDDSDWDLVAIPYWSEDENRDWWFRRRIELPDLNEGNPVVQFICGIDDEAEIYWNGKLLKKVGAAEAPWTRTVSVELPDNRGVIAVKVTGYAKPNGIYGAVVVGYYTAEPMTLDLARDLKFLGYGWERNGRGKTLRIRFQGIGSNADFDITACYGIFPGNEPWMTRWFEIRNRTPRTQLIEQIVYNRFKLTLQDCEFRRFVGTSGTVSSRVDRRGIVGGIAYFFGDTVYSPKDFLFTQLTTSYFELKPGVTLQCPKAVLGLYDGGVAKGAFTYQLYMGQYHVVSTCSKVEPLYNTWFGYYHDINEEICRRIIPIAAEIGCKLFVIDDGWQHPYDSEYWYGDWKVDPSKFPRGLKYISDLCKEHGMKLGLWFAPVMASPKSENVKKHPEWLARHADGSLDDVWGGNVAFCIASPWAGHITQTMIEHEMNADLHFFKCDSVLFVKDCAQPDHYHAPGYSVPAQIEAWRGFCNEIRRVNPRCIIDRGWEQGPEVCDMQDEGWFGDWEIGYDREREKEVRWWYWNADIYRRTLWELAWVRPSFCTAWETPCHLPIPEEDINALEYHFSSIGAYICNVEVHQRLDEMTENEKAAITRWVEWNWANRPWLAYSIPIGPQPWDPKSGKSKPHIDAVLHLRPALRGKYGMIALWNPGDEADRTDIVIDPADCYVELDFERLKLMSIKDGREILWTRADNLLLIRDFEMPPTSWDVIEILQK